MTAKNRKVVIRLSDALTQDMPTGTLEQADFSSISTRYLKESIDFARSHDFLTPAAKLLLHLPIAPTLAYNFVGYYS